MVALVPLFILTYATGVAGQVDGAGSGTIQGIIVNLGSTSVSDTTIATALALQD